MSAISRIREVSRKHWVMLLIGWQVVPSAVIVAVMFVYPDKLSGSSELVFNGSAPLLDRLVEFGMSLGQVSAEQIVWTRDLLTRHQTLLLMTILFWSKSAIWKRSLMFLLASLAISIQVEFCNLFFFLFAFGFDSGALQELSNELHSTTWKQFMLEFIVPYCAAPLGTAMGVVLWLGTLRISGARVERLKAIEIRNETSATVPLKLFLLAFAWFALILAANQNISQELMGAASETANVGFIASSATLPYRKVLLLIAAIMTGHVAMGLSNVWRRWLAIAMIATTAVILDLVMYRVGGYSLIPAEYLFGSHLIDWSIISCHCVIIYTSLAVTLGVSFSIVRGAGFRLNLAPVRDTNAAVA